MSLRHSIALFIICWINTELVFAATFLPLPPKLDNSAYILIDYASGDVLASKQAEMPLPPASLTKMLTSYIVEQKLIRGELKETDMVNMPAEAWCQGQNSQSCMFVPLNGKASVLDMLRGLIIQSGNDAARALAIHIAGSEDQFVDLMNAQAAALGMSNTHFANASGMPAPSHVSSAKDMATLARAILQHSAKYYPIYAERTFTFNGITQGNRNALLYIDPSVDGFKTGHTKEAGYCLVASSKRGNMRLISVIFGAKSMPARATQSKTLLDWGYANYHNLIVKPMGQTLIKQPVRYGSVRTVNLGLAEPLLALSVKSDAPTLDTRTVITQHPTPPITKGQVFGFVELLQNGQPAGKQPLVALETVAATAWWKKPWLFIGYIFSDLWHSITR